MITNDKVIDIFCVIDEFDKNFERENDKTSFSQLPERMQKRQNFLSGLRDYGNRRNSYAVLQTRLEG
ncbi:MAG: hypothetical protein NC206_06025 [Bacteroides sp.]|nr:hypothetical protein [Roseburia sp.]MCM1346624.1 hypothetical protein [Bacteroides sp.]MCM1421178.1 hypothetical protein [Bacteroides sp.]